MTLLSFDLARQRRALARLRRAALFSELPYTHRATLSPFQALANAAAAFRGPGDTERELCRAALDYARRVGSPHEDELAIAAWQWAEAVAAPFALEEEHHEGGDHGAA